MLNFLQYLPGSLFAPLIAIVNLLVMIGRFIYWLVSRKKRLLYYQTTFNEPLFHASCSKQILGGSGNQAAGGNRVELRYNGTQVTFPGFAEIKISNAGNVMIGQQEFSNNIMISFQNSKNARILYASVVDTKHSRYPDPQIASNSYEAALEPRSLNKGDCVKVQFL